MVTESKKRRTVLDLIEEELGGVTLVGINPEISTVGTTASLLLRGNVNRAAFILYNLSANVIFILPRNDVSTSLGIRLAPNAGVNILWKDDLVLPILEWWAVADVGAANSVLVLEMPVA